MSEINPMEQATGQTVQTAAVALQVLVLTARALSEASRREVPHPTGTQPVTDRQPAPARQPTDPDRERFGHMVRGIVRPPAVAEAMVSAPQWPHLADELKKLESAGVNVGQFLTDAAPVIARMDADMRAGTAAPGVTAQPAANLRNPWAPPPGQERAQRDEPSMIRRFVEWVKQAVSDVVERATGRTQPTALGERSRELARLGIGAQENSRLVVAARESLADEHVLGQMVNSREWPGIASQIRALQEAGHNPREALAGVPTRMQQAAAAGITLTPSEAARGLLTDQAKTPAPAPSAAATPPPPAPGPPAPAARLTTVPASPMATPATATAPVSARAVAAAARSTTADPNATPAPGPHAAPAGPTAPATPTRTHGR
ncbi:hypothetical protein [Streptomyces sp. NPDC047973]|uniref:hypothetical protein n=1 Tax=Streptomyces sp. NPDC047973 TaxID=3155383 RepID=UPI00342633B3